MSNINNVSQCVAGTTIECWTAFGIASGPTNVVDPKMVSKAERISCAYATGELRSMMFWSGGVYNLAALFHGDYMPIRCSYYSITFVVNALATIIIIYMALDILHVGNGSPDVAWMPSGLTASCILATHSNTGRVLS